MGAAPLRVLFLTPYFRPYLGGIERAIEQLTFQIQESADVEAVGVLTTKYSFPRVPQPEWPDRETTEEGIEIFRLDGYPRRSLPIYSVPLVWFSPGALRKYLQEFRPNVIHFVGDGWFWGHFWAWFWFRRRARFVFTPSFHSLPLQRSWIRPINAFLCNAVQSVVPLTDQEARQLRRAYLARESKVTVIGWGASGPKDFKGSSKNDFTRTGENNGSASPFTILCVGRLGQHKGQMWLLDVYREARSKFVKPVRLVFVGRDEGDEATIAAAIKDQGLSGEVVMTGEVSDEELDAWYSQADLFTLFSQYEAFGLVFFEAMAYGVPVLTHDVGANRELLTRGAVVVPKFDRQATITEMVRLVNESSELNRLGSEAKEYVQAEFTWQAVGEKYLNVYRAIS